MMDPLPPQSTRDLPILHGGRRSPDARLAPWLAEATRLWGPCEPTIDSQACEVPAGGAIGPIDWVATPKDVDSAIAVLGAASTELLAADGTVRMLTGEVLHPLEPSDRIRFLPQTERSWAGIVLLRRSPPARPGTPRTGARVYLPDPEPSLAELPGWAADRALVYHTGFTSGEALPEFSHAEVAAEPCVASCSPDEAMRVGGPLLRAFVERLPADWRASDDVIIGGKRDELSPGWQPCVVGWHMDGTSRARKRADGTPDLLDPVRRQRQIAACVGPVSPTSFLVGTLTLPLVPEGLPPGVGGRVWQTLLRRQLAEGAAEVRQAIPGRMFSFGWGDFHICTPSAGIGWRYFLKAMIGRGDVPANRIERRSTVARPFSAGPDRSAVIGIFTEGEG